MTDQQKDRILRALRRFFSTRDSQDEGGEKIFDRWFDSFDDSEGYLDRLSQREREEYRNRIFQSVNKELKVTEYSYRQPLHRNRTGRWSMFNRVAAILVIGTVLSLAGAYLSGVTEPEVVPVVMVQKSNPIGQISEIALPDGSVVWLSAASTLAYPEEFSGTNRAVDLDGEAFFEVTRDTDRPFIVNSGPLSTRVLGTSFNIRAYRNDPDVEVTLVTGRVEVTANEGGQTQTLAPNQQVSYTREAGLGETREADALLARAWTERELVFMRESFATIARTFERWYGVEFIFEEESLKEEEFVYHFKELSLRNSMIILNELADFEYEITDQKVIIKQPNSQPVHF